ncbi:PTS sugar transporter subunit IIA [Spirochaeta isovalerica]|uniref:PTS system nitrogen regulatory IIA component n=1 Tax=Spirochaeta isovalerica TaxID=150 RepID=A0A841R3I3_9SPIO|nr:PTS sugar transporter subunit IIA [Spirochaeta isovalerica]MBB6478435.1 PTS system nitrogen regulatory IIA component [Spirochaeta isovalerica]
MKLKDWIKKDQCMVLQSTTKTETILEMLDVIATTGKIGDMENLKKEIFYREQIMSTGIGQGLAVPHVRFDGAREPIVLIGTKAEGLSDYESLDNAPVRIVVMIIVGAEQHREYLRILSLVAHKLKDHAFQEELLKAENGEDMALLIAGE